MFCNMIIGGAAEALVFPIGECKVPEGFDGPGQSPFPLFTPQTFLLVSVISVGGGVDNSAILTGL